MKVMCWLYYKFERLMPFLGDDNPPRILYECNAVTAHELILLRILSMMGTDILLLEPQGDAAYLKQDAASAWSQLLSVQGCPSRRISHSSSSARKWRRQRRETCARRRSLRRAR